MSATADELLSTGTASVGVIVEAEQIENLPMSGRAPSSLIKLSAGVLDQTSPVANTRPFDNSGTSSFSMGGGQNRTNELLLDGGPNMARDRRVSYNPPADIVQEVTIETFQSDASYGNSASGTVNIVTKSGTNRFSGVGRLLHAAVRHRRHDYFTKRAGGDEPPFNYKQGGLTVGGPVVIPRRDRRQETAVLDRLLRQHPEQLFDARADDGADGSDAARRLLGAAPPG